MTRSCCPLSPFPRPRPAISAAQIECRLEFRADLVLEGEVADFVLSWMFWNCIAGSVKQVTLTSTGAQSHNDGKLCEFTSCYYCLLISLI